MNLPGYDRWKTTPPEPQREREYDDRELEEERNGDNEVS